ncbi:hypothetical protein MMPV_001887 [Pyropia vietnamensis]
MDTPATKAFPHHPRGPGVGRRAFPPFLVWAASVVIVGIGIVSCAVTPAAAGRPTILVPPASSVILPAGEEGTLAVVAVNQAGDGHRGLSYQWEVLAAGGRERWAPLPGETRRTFTATMPCTSQDNPTYRVAVTSGVASQGDGNTTWSRVSRWRPEGIGLPQLLEQPPPVIALTDGQGGSVSWTVRHPAKKVVLSMSVYFSSPGGRTPLPPGMGVRRVTFPGAESLAQMVLSWTPAGVAAVRQQGLDGRSLRLRYEATCLGGGPEVGGPFLARDTVVLLAGGAAEAAAPTPLPTCGGPAKGTSTADLDGWLLNDGSTAATAGDCSTCRSRCAAMPGCNVWCWLKRRRPLAGQPPVKPPASGRDTPAPAVWLSGTVDERDPPACPGRWGADVDGEVVRAGTANRQTTCAGCRAACAADMRCNVWVWGFKGFRSERHTECWLKRVPDVESLVYKAGSFKSTSQWLSGTISR